MYMYISIKLWRYFINFVGKVGNLIGYAIWAAAVKLDASFRFWFDVIVEKFLKSDSCMWKNWYNTQPAISLIKRCDWQLNKVTPKNLCLAGDPKYKYVLYQYIFKINIGTLVWCCCCIVVLNHVQQYYLHFDSNNHWIQVRFHLLQQFQSWQSKTAQPANEINSLFLVTCNFTICFHISCCFILKLCFEIHFWIQIWSY